MPMILDEIRADYATRAEALAPIALGWHRDTGALAWLGQLGEAIAKDRLNAQNYIRVDTLVDALQVHRPLEPDRTEPPLRFELRRDADAITAWAALGELPCELDVVAAAELTARGFVLQQRARGQVRWQIRSWQRRGTR